MCIKDTYINVYVYKKERDTYIDRHVCVSLPPSPLSPSLSFLLSN